MFRVIRMLLGNLFEFTDLSWLPSGLRTTLTEMIEVVNTRFRCFNGQAAEYVLEVAQRLKRRRILELGAGEAPLCRELAARSNCEHLELLPSDRTPNTRSFKELAKRYPGRVLPRFDSVDYSADIKLDREAIAVFLSTFHHLPERARIAVLKRLTGQGLPVVLLEALRPDLQSFLLCLSAPIGGLRLPLALLDRPGRMRRFFWCWVFPVLPLIFCWDAIVSTLRQWDKAQWQQAYAELGNENVGLEIREDVCLQFVLFYPRSAADNLTAQTETAAGVA